MIQKLLFICLQPCLVTQGQMFKDNKFVPHFGLFALINSGKVRDRTDSKITISRHMKFYINYFREIGALT